jgi:hypothetical protein
MYLWLADPPFFGGPGQGTRQIIELFVAFGLTSLIGLEREIQGKSAGVRTQTIGGTAAALILLVSKYGFTDVLQDGLVVVDPSPPTGLRPAPVAAHRSRRRRGGRAHRARKRRRDADVVGQGDSHCADGAGRHRRHHGDPSARRRTRLAL